MSFWRRTTVRERSCAVPRTAVGERSDAVLRTAVRSQNSRPEDQTSDRERGSAPGADLGDFDLDPELDLGQHRVEAGVAGAVPEPGRGRLQPGQGGGPDAAAEHLDLEFV